MVLNIRVHQETLAEWRPLPQRKGARDRLCSFN
jgi:hypothetical protein